MRFLWIAVGAALGANARYLVGLWAGARWGGAFPYGTFLVNVTGSLMLGFLLAMSMEHFLTSSQSRLLLATGFLGSYTTFSTYMVESVNLLETGRPTLALANLAGETAVGLACALLGIWLVRALGW
ncbi:MAG: fluoride efflux transporter CrcB [Caldilineaceae bacterium]|nr:fluoride efflux transporter CrcB [Caldilineaceae bacterium]MCB9138013.1 fluoride efflux transporter CrcB [Caldilineaceae bacterium]